MGIPAVHNIELECIGEYMDIAIMFFLGFFWFCFKRGKMNAVQYSNFNEKIAISYVCHSAMYFIFFMQTLSLPVTS